MAATFSYYYTVDTYVKWSTIQDSDESVSGVGQVILDEVIDSNMPDWIPLHTESTNTTVIKHTIQKGFQIKWRVRFYCKKVDGSTTTWYWLSDDAVKNVHASFAAYRGKVSTTDPKVKTYHAGDGVTTAFTIPNTTVVSNPTGGATFSFWLNPTQSNFTLSPAFVLSADIQINTTDLLSKYGGDSNTNIQHATLLGANPSFTVYDAKPVPSATPPSLESAIEISGNSFSYAFDRCNNDWFGLSITPTKATSNGVFSYSFFTVTCKANGTGLQKSSVVTETVKGNLTNNNVGSQLKAVRKKMQAVLVADCSSQSGANPGGGGGGGGGNNSVPNTGNSSTTASSDQRWNPPTHRYSRDIPYTLRSITNDVSDSINQGINSDLNALATQALLESGAAIKDFTSLQNGRLFQDASGAQTLNTNPDKLKSIDAIKGPKQWGFRFMYNPTTFGYQTSSNNSVDFTFGAKDPATLLAGNQNVSFQLYINRIPDMAYLHSLANGNSRINISESFAYGRALYPEEKAGLLNRGTEYDIEFIYRVLNGDPTSKPLLFSQDYQGLTADFGYTTATPCWLVLNDNLRYYGSVSSLDVNHVMFDLNMVPILTTVTIQFSRIPALWNDTAAGGYSRADLQNKLSGNLIGTPTTTS